MMPPYPEPVSPQNYNRATQGTPTEQQHTRRIIMPIKNPRELFVHMLSNLRQGTERATKLVQEFSQNVQDIDIREALEARISSPTKFAILLTNVSNSSVSSQ